jgi:hypothetical protein
MLGWCWDGLETGVLGAVSFIRKHWLLFVVILELIAAAALTGWLIAGAVLGG